MIKGIPRALETLQDVAGRVVDVVLPPQCPCCGAILLKTCRLCPACWMSVEFIGAPCCNVTGLPFAYDPGSGAMSAVAIADAPKYDRARVVARYDDGTRDLVHALKYRDRLDIADLLGSLMAFAGKALLEDADFLVPVPLYRMRLWRRRFNQSAELANVIARLTGVETRHNVLRRVRPTRPQVGLTADQRHRNVSGAFAVTDNARPETAGMHVVLIDDVITTGATANACAVALRAAFAERVDVLAFARVVEHA